MKTELHFINTGKNEALEAMVAEKLAKIDKKYSWVTNAAVFLKGEQHKEGDNFCCEVRLSVPGPQLYAEATETTFNRAVHEVFHQLDVQLEKHKDKMYDKTK